MSKHKTLKDFEQQIRECVKCGACQANCPTYGSKRKEGAVARGKITLAASVLDGETKLEKELLQDMSMCMMCGSCVTVCPNKVPTDQIVGAMRRQITDEKGMSLIGKGVETVLGHPKLMKTLIKGGALASPLLFKKVPESSGLRLRFPTPIMNKRTIPPMAKKTLFDRFPEFIEGKPGMPTVGFFTGCSITYMYPEIGEKMVRVLKHMGFSIYMPHSQGCCGIPGLSSGAGKLVEKLAENNVKVFGERKVDHIVTACASCNGGIGEYYETMKADYDAFAHKVVDIQVFLQQQGLVEKLAALPKWDKRTRVTYHDPCHLRLQGITKEPRAVLKALPNIDFVEMEGAGKCCGLGGTFSVYHYDTSKDIGAKKIPGLKESGASHLATACPGCIMQLQDNINHAGLSVEACHILDFVNEALDDLKEGR